MTSTHESFVFNKLITDTYKMRKPRVSEVNRTKPDILAGPSVIPDGPGIGKHRITTPGKRRLKNVKRGSKDDVHTMTSPRTPKSTQGRKTPSSSPCTPKGTSACRPSWFLSQEAHGDVTWDYTSPRKQLDSVKKYSERKKSAVADLLKGLKTDKGSAICRSQVSGMKLMDKWMSNNSSQMLFTAEQDLDENESMKFRKLDCTDKAERAHDMDKKIKELLQVVKSETHLEEMQSKGRISGITYSKDEDRKAVIKNKSCHDEKVMALEMNFINEECYDTSEELWEDDSDDSFIIRATQMSEELLEACAVDTSNLCIQEKSQCSDTSLPSLAIPETIVSTTELNIQSGTKLTCLKNKIYETDNTLNCTQNLTKCDQGKLNVQSGAKLTCLKNKTYETNNTLNCAQNLNLTKYDQGEIVGSSKISSKTASNANEIRKQIANDTMKETLNFDEDDDLWEDSSSVDEILCSIPEEELLDSSDRIMCNNFDTKKNIIVTEEKKGFPKMMPMAENGNKQTRLVANNVKSPRKYPIASPKFKITQKKYSKQVSDSHTKVTRDSGCKEKLIILSDSSHNTSGIHTELRTSHNLNVIQVKNVLDSKLLSATTCKVNDAEDMDSDILQPEVLHWLDQIESQAFESQRCTPEEIAQKRENAIKRRQKKKQQKQTCAEKTHAIHKAK